MSQQPEDYEVHTAKPAFVSSADSSLSVDPDSSQPPSSLTPSDASDTTRVYDLNSRQTSILKHEIIRASRLPARDITETPATPANTPNSPNAASSHSPKYERSESFKQLDKFMRAIEKQNSPISVTVKPSSSVYQHFGNDELPITPPAMANIDIDIVAEPAPANEAAAVDSQELDEAPTFSADVNDDVIVAEIEQTDEVDHMDVADVSAVVKNEVQLVSVFSTKSSPMQ